jgi:cytochrome c oxidase cbb3-type subunit I/II
MVFSLMLWAPSWGGMLNGLLTLRGAWDKVRRDPVLKFFAAAVTFYGMATFEGPLLSIKSVSALGHYTDWIIGHVHGGALGWNGLMAAGLFYWLVPRLFGTKLWSRALADFHFWIAIFGILLYMAAMWTSGVTQGLMWRAETADGALQYASWMETVHEIQPMYWMRAIGGSLFLVGWVLMIVNLLQTARSGVAVDGETTVAVLPRTAPDVPARRLLLGKPVLASFAGIVALVLFGLAGPVTAPIAIGLMLLVLGWVASLLWQWSGEGARSWHQRIEARPLTFSVLVLAAVLVGGVVELVPGLLIQKQVPLAPDGSPSVTPYSALELEGRDVYVKEGCYVCHSQMIRPFRAEKLRYGDPSRIEESLFDHPFQWGSKRTGPDLARVGGKYTDDWHWQHMLQPGVMTDGSIMPAYPWLAGARIDPEQARAKLRAMRQLGVPYTKEQVAAAPDSYRAQARAVVANLAARGVTAAEDCELVALIAYLQRLGRAAGTKVSDAR